MTVFFFVNEFDIHKFVIYYANGHLNYLSLVLKKEIFRFDNDDYFSMRDAFAIADAQ